MAANPQGGREGVVRRLVEVHVVARENARGVAWHAAEQLQRPVGEHLVHVHVGAGACAALERIHDDVRAEIAAHQLLAGLAQRGHDLRREVVELRVRLQTGELHCAVGAYQIPPHRAPGEREVRERAGGVDAVQGARGQRELTEQVPLGPGRGGGQGGAGHGRRDAGGGRRPRAAAPALRAHSY
jgi:hypothetical protein